MIYQRHGDRESQLPDLITINADLAPSKCHKDLSKDNIDLHSWQDVTGRLEFHTSWSTEGHWLKY